MIAIDAGWLKVLEDGKPKTSKEIGSVTASQPELIGQYDLHPLCSRI